MLTKAVIFEEPKKVALRGIRLDEPGLGDVAVAVRYTGISTGTEKLFWSGTMPPFPGMGYPMVPGYESVGRVMAADRSSGFSVGDEVFVPGANCFGDVRGLFGGAARYLVSPADRVVRVDPQLGASGTLMALAATARHAMAGINNALPELIVGHGVVGRLLARLTLAAGGPPPTVWEINEDRQDGATGYEVVRPDDDLRRDYNCIYDATGDSGILDSLIQRLATGGELVLAGFYPQPLSFAFPPAFMREARIRVAAEWTRDDLIATRDLVDQGALSLDGLITHQRPASQAPEAYCEAFEDPRCLKMILDWEATA